MESHTQQSASTSYPTRKTDVMIKEICDHSVRFGNPYVFISALRTCADRNGDTRKQDEHDARGLRQEFIKTIPSDLSKAWEFFLSKDGLRIVRDVSYKKTLDHLTDEYLMQFYLLIAFLDIEPAYGHTLWETTQSDLIDYDENDFAKCNEQCNLLNDQEYHHDAKLKRASTKYSQLEQWFIDYMAEHRLIDLLKEANGNLPRGMALLQRLLGIEFDIPQMEFDGYIQHFSSIINLDGLTYDTVRSEILAMGGKDKTKQESACGTDCVGF